MVKVSIVVPIYNVERYLDECLISIKKQTLQDIEIICVDDGSTDNSKKIVEKYMARDPRFKLISKPNAGYGDSMNRGFDAASGEYVGIVESDDYIERDMFEVLYNAAKKNDCQIVKSDYYEFTTTKKKNQSYIQTPTDKKYYNEILNHTITHDIFHFRMNTWTGIYLNQFIRENKIVHNLTPGASYQDNGFWFQTLSLANRIMFIDRAFYHYRQDNPNSSINSKTKVYCMCDEYSFIQSNLEKDKDLSDELMPVFLVKKYFNYMYTYNRISSEYKIDFLKRFSEEFRLPLENGVITAEDCGSNIYAMIRRIVQDPVRFYYEDTIWRIQHETSEKCLAITRIKKMKNYPLLHKMRLI